MEDLSEILNPRELATIIWVILFALWALSRKSVRTSACAVLRAGASLWIPLLSMAMYVAGIVCIFYHFHFWEFSFLKITLFWFFGSALAMFVDVPNPKKRAGYVRETVLRIVGITVIVSFITNFYTFGFWAEFILIPIIATAAALAAYVDVRRGFRHVGILMNGILTIIGLFMLVISFGRVMLHYREFATFSTLQEFLLPIVLSLSLVPLLWLWSLYIEHEAKKTRNLVIEENKRKQYLL